jgi:hypothetical protein
VSEKVRRCAARRGDGGESCTIARSGTHSKSEREKERNKGKRTEAMPAGGSGGDNGEKSSSARESKKAAGDELMSRSNSSAAARRSGECVSVVTSVCSSHEAYRYRKG